MYRDNTLIPTEAVRLAALGELMAANRLYGSLAADIRHIVARLVGPSLDLLGSSLELLRVEGLIAPVSGDDDELGQDTELTITEDGRRTFETLMGSAVRMPMNDVSRLVIALKLNYLALLTAEARRHQIEVLIELFEGDLNRLRDLKQGLSGGDLVDWLDLDIRQTEQRLEWLRGRRDAA